MSATVFSFPTRKKGPEPWTNEELAELYRVVDILARAGLATETDMGLSDEGDPWFVFCRADTGDVIAHFARIDGQFVAASIAIDETYKGANFRQIVDQIVRSQPLMLPPPGPGTRLLLHPAVILTAFVATALAHSEKAMAADSLRPVEAKFDAHHAHSADQIAKAAKPSWFDSIQHMLLRNPIVDAKGNHDSQNSVNSGQGVSLASLIAIAMTAMQPFVEKLSFISEAAAADLTVHAHGSAGVVHADPAATIDLLTIDQSAVLGDTVVVVRSDSQDDVQLARKDIIDIHSTADQVKIADSHSAAQQSTAPKVPFASTDDTVHTTFNLTPDLSAEASANLMAQKAAALLVAPVVSTTTVTPAVFSIKDINPQVLQMFNIDLNGADPTTKLDPHSPSVGDGSHTGGTTPTGGSGDDGSHGGTTTSQATDSHTSSDGTAATTGSTVIASGATSSSTTTDTPTTTHALPTEHYSTLDGVTALDAIINYAESGVYDFKTAVSPSASLEASLAQIAGSSGSLKVIVYESSATLQTDIFSFAPGVVFVSESYFASSQAALHSSAGQMVLDLATTGESVTLIGVATVDLNHPAG